MAYRYNAFISYSHEGDQLVATSLQKGLERFGKRWNRLRALSIFRDQTELSASPDLWSSIEAALAESEYFILLASPSAAKSKWVRKEVEYWLQRRSLDTLLLVVTQGEVAWNEKSGDFNWKKTNAVPANLKGRYQREPLYLDMRTLQTATVLSLSNPEFERHVAALSSKLHGRHLGDMIRENDRQHRNAMRLRIGTGAAVAVLALLSLWLFFYSRSQGSVLQTQEREATSAQLVRAADTSARNLEWNRALLLSAQAFRTQDSIQTRSALLRSVQAVPRYLRAILQEPIGKAQPATGRSPAVALSADGRLLAAIGAPGTTSIGLWDHPRERKQVFELSGHTRPPNVIALSRDASKVASGGPDGIILWDALNKRMQRWVIRFPVAEPATATPRTTASPEPSSSVIDQVDDPNKLVEDALKRLVKASAAQTAAQQREVEALTFSPDGQLLAWAGAADVWFWNIESAVIRRLPLTLGGIAKITDLRFSSHGEFLAVMGVKGDIREEMSRLSSQSAEERSTRTLVVTVVDLRTNQTAMTESMEATAIAFSPSADILAVAKPDGTAILWDAVRRRLAVELPSHGQRIGSLAFAPDGRSMAVGQGTTLNVWDLSSRRILYTMDGGHRSFIHSVAFGGGGVTIVSMSWDGAVVLWDTESAPLGHTVAHLSGQKALAFDQRGRTIGAVAAGGDVSFYDVASGDKVHGYRLPAGVESITPIRNSDFVLVGADGRVYWLQPRTGNESLIPDGVAPRSASALGRGPDGSSLLAIGDKSGWLSLVDAKDWTVRQQLSRAPDELKLLAGMLTRKTEPDAVSAVALDSRGQRVASVHEGRLVRLWSLNTERRTESDGTPLTSRRDGLENERTALGEDGTSQEVLGIRFTPLGNGLIAWGPKGYVHLDVPSLSTIGRSRESPEQTVQFTDVSDDTRLFASVKQSSSEIQIRELPSGLSYGGPLTAIAAGKPESLVTGPLRFSADGTHLAAVYGDGSLFVWDLDPESHIARACHFSTRNLTNEEWKTYVGGPYQSTCPNLPVPRGSESSARQRR